MDRRYVGTCPICGAENRELRFDKKCFDCYVEAEWDRDRPCIRCGNDLDTTPGGHICSVTDEEWTKMIADDGMPF